MKQDVQVVNIMADGTICEDLTTYLDKHQLPEETQRIMLELMKLGAKIRAGG